MQRLKYINQFLLMDSDTLNKKLFHIQNKKTRKNKAISENNMTCLSFFGKILLCPLVHQERKGNENTDKDKDRGSYNNSGN